MASTGAADGGGRRGEGPSSAMPLANSHAERRTPNSPSSRDVMTEFSPAHENLRVRREGMAAAGIAGGAQSRAGVWGWALAALFQKIQAGSAHPLGQADKPASVQPPPEASLKGARGTDPGQAARGRAPT